MQFGTLTSWILYRFLQFIPIIRNIFCFNHFQIIQQYCVRIALLTINVACLSVFRRFWLKSYIIYNVNNFEYCNRLKKSNNNNNNNDGGNDNKSNNGNNSDGMSSYVRTRKKRIIYGFTIVFTILILCQFHYLFYISRLLPNIFALAVVTLSFAFYFLSNFDRCLQLLAISTIVWRADTIVIAVPMIVLMCYKAYCVCTLSYTSDNVSSNLNNDIANNKQQKPIKMGRENKSVSNINDIAFWKYYFDTFLKWFLFSGAWVSVVTIIIVCLIDTPFWNKVPKYSDKTFIWPEWEVFRYNAPVVGEDKSSDWGESPIYWYFVAGMPKMLLANYLLAFVAVFKLSPLYVSCAIVFLCLFSFVFFCFVFFSFVFFGLDLVVLFLFCFCLCKDSVPVRVAQQ